jgi:hypothetical protein
LSQASTFCSGFTHVTARRIAQPPKGDRCHEAPTHAVTRTSRLSVEFARLWFSPHQNLRTTAATPSLAALAGLAGCEAHSEKQEKQGISTNGLLGTNALTDCGAAKAAKPAKVKQIEPLLVGYICQSPDDWRSRFDQRTAIAEHDRGFSRAEAELHRRVVERKPQSFPCWTMHMVR